MRVSNENGSRGFYAKVSWVKEFDGDLDFKVNGAPFKDSFGDDWRVYGVGCVSKVNDRNSLYFDLERSSGGVFEQDWAIKAGWRIEFQAARFFLANKNGVYARKTHSRSILRAFFRDD